MSPEESDQFKAFSLGDKWNKAQEKKLKIKKYHDYLPTQ